MYFRSMSYVLLFSKSLISFRMKAKDNKMCVSGTSFKECRLTRGAVTSLHRVPLQLRPTLWWGGDDFFSPPILYPYWFSSLVLLEPEAMVVHAAAVLSKLNGFWLAASRIFSVRAKRTHQLQSLPPPTESCPAISTTTPSLIHLRHRWVCARACGFVRVWVRVCGRGNGWRAVLSVIL